MTIAKPIPIPKKEGIRIKKDKNIEMNTSKNSPDPEYEGGEWAVDIGLFNATESVDRQGDGFQECGVLVMDIDM
jgi:hypothetical protein